MIRVIPLDTLSLGDRSYVVSDGHAAIAIDPQRDIDRVLRLVEDLGVPLTHVLETHIHNDYVTGGYQLAQRTGAAYVVSANDDVAYERLAVRDGDVLEAGGMRVRVLHTPGHTFTHLAYAVEARDRVVGVFTGGSLLYGTTGRPDLLGKQHAETLARHQHASVHRLAAELPEDTPVYPTHGFGSFCSATQAEGDHSTIAAERAANPALRLDEDAFVDELLAGLDAYPAYYAHMGPANAAGPGPIDLTPPAVADPSELRRRIDAGEWVVDLRTRTAFAAGHVRGTISLGLDGSFVTYLGWLIPWGTPVTLLAETPAEIEAAQRDLARIGIDRPAAQAVGGPQSWAGAAPLATTRTATFADLRRAQSRATPDVQPLVIDLRRDEERREGHVAGTRHIPLHELPARLEEVPADREVWVHCAAGYRAAIGGSLLERAGRSVVVVNDEFDNAVGDGLQVFAPTRAAASV